MKIIFIVVTFCASWALLFCMRLLVVQAQSSATSTITIQRRGATTTAANQALARDVERFVRAYAPSVTQPTAKDGDGKCLPFMTTIESESVNLEIYVRDATTCAVVILASGRTDLRNQAALDGALERLIRALFNGVTDSIVARDKFDDARKAADDEIKTRKGEKPEADKTIK